MQTMLLVILVEFVIKREDVEKFRPLIAQNARTSLSSEPGCLRFDVLSIQQEPNSIVLYEIYQNEAAFGSHLQTLHYKVFAEASKEMIESVSVRRLNFVEPSKEKAQRL
jgi:(4S)-4-hydroxy-5-phosphonooxypentane-2,3-dione isomerase